MRTYIFFPFFSVCLAGTAFFVLPLTSGEVLNTDENPIQLAGQGMILVKRREREREKGGRD